MTTPTLMEAWHEYEQTVLPILFRELVHQLASSHDGSDAMARLYPLLKDVFFTGAEVYQCVMFKLSKVTREQQEDAIAGLVREITAYTEEAKSRWTVVKH